MIYKTWIVSLFILLGYASSSNAQLFEVVDPDKVAAPFIGKPLPLLETTTLRGDNFNTTDNIGNGILLHIWSLSCAACYKELPELNLLADQYKTKGIKIISLLVEDRDTALQKITIKDSLYQLKKKVFGNDKINFELVPVSKAQAKRFIKELSFPVDYFIDSKGLISYYSEGYFESPTSPRTNETDNYKYIRKKLDQIATN